MEIKLENELVLCDFETSCMLKSLGVTTYSDYGFIKNPINSYTSKRYNGVYDYSDDGLAGMYSDELGTHVFTDESENIYRRYDLYTIQRFLISLGYEIAVIYFKKGYLTSNNKREIGTNNYKITTYHEKHEDALECVIKETLLKLLDGKTYADI